MDEQMHCTRCKSVRVVFLALECEELTEHGEPVRVMSYDTRFTPRYELWGCRSCGKGFVSDARRDTERA